MLSWHVTSVEVSLWTSSGLPHGVRKWKADKTDFERIAQEIAQFITGSEVETGANRSLHVDRPIYYREAKFYAFVHGRQREEPCDGPRYRPLDHSLLTRRRKSGGSSSA